MKTPKDKKRIPLGDLLREKTATSRSRLEKEAKEKQRLREKPFVDWAKSLIKELPRILKAIADEGGTEYIVYLSLNGPLNDEINNLRVDEQISNLLREAYGLRFNPTAGRMLQTFCEDNGLTFDSRLDSDGCINVIIAWN
ncbi:MAG: hypothetical protein WC473_05170 [Patescibacteria group bacterium]|jgi:hypothetical protein